MVDDTIVLSHNFFTSTQAYLCINLFLNKMISYFFPVASDDIITCIYFNIIFIRMSDKSMSDVMTLLTMTMLFF